MIAKDKMFIIAGNVDDSIKATTPIYDVTIYPNFLAFEDFVSNTPIALSSIIISERELPFTAFNMSKLLNIITSPFLRLNGKVMYLIELSTSKELVQHFLDDNDIQTIVCYQGDLSMRYITDIVTGAARVADESETEIVTYRMRANDYIAQQEMKRYQSDEDDFLTDEDELSDIPTIKEPEPVIPSIDILTTCYYVVGKQSIKRTLFAFIEAQYLALNGRTIIMEADTQYHTLTDMVKKSDINYDYIDIEDLLSNCSKTINEIKEGGNKLIILGAVNRIVYDYNFLYDILINNLSGHIDYFVKECDFVNAPYQSSYNIICGNTVPELLECVQSLKYDVDPNKVVFVGMMTEYLGAVNITSREMSDILQLLLNKPEIPAQVVRAKGICLKGDEIAYDVFSIIGRGNER